MKARAQREGMTLVEIMIVMTILALITTAALFGIGKITKADLKQACTRVVAASRFAYARAATNSNTTRVVIDCDTGQLAVEEAHGRVTITRADDRLSDEEEDVAVDPWTAAESRLESTFEPSFGASPFGPIRGPSGEALNQYKPQPLASGMFGASEIGCHRLLLPHEQGPREAGKGSVYFFPGGRSEHAILQLTDGTDVYTVEIHPLTGRGTVHNRPYEPEVVLDEESQEVRDPG